MAVSPNDSEDNKNSHLPFQQNKTHLPSSSKRMKSPAVRVVGGQTQPLQNSKTCHQCRQRTAGLFASCKNVGDKHCAINFCRKCLLNRYGENVEEAGKQEDWKCPKCRGVCNCSVCMKRKGHRPTGAMAQAAKATGFSSVLEMLQLKGAEGLPLAKKNVQDSHASPNKSTVASKVLRASKRKYGKENSSVDPNVLGMPLLNDGEAKLKSETAGKKFKTDEGKYNAFICNVRGDCVEKKDDLVAKVVEKTPVGPIREVEKVDGSVGVLLGGDEIKVPDGEVKPSLKRENFKIKKCAVRSRSKDVDADIALPQYHDLVTVGGVNLPADDVGSALQFLEFCAAFRQVLDLKKGQPEAVLRELTRGRVRRTGNCGLYSSIAQFHIKLLSMLQEDFEEDGSWLQALGRCISESQFGSKQFRLKLLKRGGDGYNRLNPSKKLRLLNFLCNETLGTEQLRKWIDKEHSKYVEAMKEAKARVLAAKEKEKLVTQKLKDEMANALLPSTGAPLSIMEHENLIRKMRNETEKAHAEMLETMAEALKTVENQTLDAVRTESILLDGDGRVYWRLRSYSDRSCFLLQDIGELDSVKPQDKWFIYDDDHQEAIEKYVSLRLMETCRSKL